MNFFIFVTTCDPRMKNCVFLIIVLFVSVLPYMYVCASCVFSVCRGQRKVM